MTNSRIAMQICTNNMTIWRHEQKKIRKERNNFELSKNRVITVQNILTQNGFNKNKIVIIEGKGRVIVQKDMVENLSETRSKNRRVDLFIVKKNSFGNVIYNSFQEKHKVGDRIYLENILFPLGSSALTEQSKNSVDL